MYTRHMRQQSNETDPFVVYARSLHDYTLKLWTESIRLSEEKSRNRASGKAKRKGEAPSADRQAETMKAAA